MEQIDSDDSMDDNHSAKAQLKIEQDEFNRKIAAIEQMPEGKRNLEMKRLKKS